MDVHLDAKTESLIQERIDQGQFPDAAEVVREAIRQMDEREHRLALLRSALQKGIDQLDRGEFVERTPQFPDEIFERAKRAARGGVKPNPDVLP